MRGAVDDNKGTEDKQPSVAMNAMRAHQLQSEEDDDVNDVCVVKVLLVVPVSVLDSTDVSPILWYFLLWRDQLRQREISSLNRS